MHRLDFHAGQPDRNNTSAMTQRPVSHYIIVPSPEPLLALAERRCLHRLLPGESRLVLVDVVSRWVAEGSGEFRSFLQSHRDRIDTVATAVGHNLEVLERPSVDRRLVPAATGEFLVCHLDQTVGQSPAVLICDDAHSAAWLERMQSKYPENVRLLRFSDYLSLDRLPGANE